MSTAARASMRRKSIPKIIKLDNNRIDVVFEINEGPTTKVRAINFIGNTAFSDSQLRYVISTTQTTLLSFLKSTNIYDPDRLNLDRELLRQFYLKNGYADVRDHLGHRRPRPRRPRLLHHLHHRGGRAIPLRRLSTSKRRCLRSTSTRCGGYILTRTGRVYNAEKVEKTVEALTIGASQQGYAFAPGQAALRPRRGQPPHQHHLRRSSEGPRVYIERINIVGNFRTQDDVIRREFRLAEGDAFNRAAGRGRAQALARARLLQDGRDRHRARQRARPRRA